MLKTIQSASKEKKTTQMLFSEMCDVYADSRKKTTSLIVPQVAVEIMKAIKAAGL